MPDPVPPELSPSEDAFPAPDREFVSDYLRRSAAAMAAFETHAPSRRTLFAMAARVSAALRAGHKLLVAGNGGSAADAQHIAGEFVSRLMYDRRPLAAVALTTDTSALTAVGNDYGFEHLFSRQVDAIGRPGDLFLGISTSGRSPNVLRALDAARAGGLHTLGFCGAEAPVMAGRCDELLAVPSSSTPVIQQLHITAAHILCALVERALCPRATPPAA